MGFVNFLAISSVAFWTVASAGNIKTLKDEVFESEEVSKGGLQGLLEYRENVERLSSVGLQYDLNSDMEDFLKLLDVEAILVTFLEFLEDPEVMNLVVFFLSPEFQKMVVEFEAMPEFKEAFVFLSSKGYDLAPIINSIHEIISLPPYQTARKGKGGLTGLIDAILETLPVEELKELFREKMANSPEFAELFETINSEELKDMLDRMSRNERFLEAKARFEGMGLDFGYIQRIIEGISQLD